MRDEVELGVVGDDQHGVMSRSRSFLEESQSSAELDRVDGVGMRVVRAGAKCLESLRRWRRSG
jgi:hypothetical protein